MKQKHTNVTKRDYKQIVALGDLPQINQSLAR